MFNFNAEQDDIERQVNLQAESHKQICDAWKAAGPKASSESFKAQLSQQDSVIAAARRNAAEISRQRDTLIDADIKQRIAQEDKAAKDRDRERARTEGDRIAAAQRDRDAKLQMESAARDEKLRQECLSELAKGNRPCGCWKYDPVKGGACTK